MKVLERALMVKLPLLPEREYEILTTLSLFDEVETRSDLDESPSKSSDDLWNLDGTIHDYSYLTHNFFRYYGKFPSVLAKKVIEEFVGKEAPAKIIDNYSGSGTTLVEAALSGHNAVGVDINPLGVLSANVKTTCISTQELEDAYCEILACAKTILADGSAELGLALLSAKDIEKWFPAQAALELSALRSAVYYLECGKVKDFYLLAFASIIRRVSNAHDGEVRPHVKKDKVFRSPLEVFEKKSLDMRRRLKEFKAASNQDVSSTCYFGDNRALLASSYFEEESFDLALTHPPYVNCFDYLPVYRLELLWLDDLFLQWSLQPYNLLGNRSLGYKELRKMETRSWPATPQIVEEYRSSNTLMLDGLWRLLRPGANCCVVIGDSTSKGELLPVHQWFIEMGKSVGFNHQRTIYRTTHYGTGKYAYEARAHYHGTAEKRDAIVVFNKS